MFYQALTCSYKDHVNEPIIGFCLNSECQENNKYCSQCILNKHLTHTKDCKSMNQIKQLIQNTLKIIDKWQTKTIHDLQKANELYKDITLFLNNQQKKLMNLKEEIDLELFQELGHSTVSLIAYYEIQRTDQQIYSINQLEQLEKWHEFCQSLNNIGKSCGSDEEKPKINENKESDYYQRGKFQYNLNLLADAFLNFDQCIQINSQNQKALIYKGCILNDMLRFEDAIKCYDDVLKLNSQNTAALNNKGLALSQLNCLEEALLCFQAVLNLEPFDEFALINMGITLNTLQREEKAKECFQKAMLKNRSLALSGKKKHIIGFRLHHSKGTKKQESDYQEIMQVSDDEVNPIEMKFEYDSSGEQNFHNPMKPYKKRGEKSGQGKYRRHYRKQCYKKKHDSYKKKLEVFLEKMSIKSGDEDVGFEIACSKLI